MARCKESMDRVVRDADGAGVPLVGRRQECSLDVDRITHMYSVPWFGKLASSESGNTLAFTCDRGPSAPARLCRV